MSLTLTVLAVFSMTNPDLGATGIADVDRVRSSRTISSSSFKVLKAFWRGVKLGGRLLEVLEAAGALEL
jgi:hypothetical protein